MGKTYFNFRDGDERGGRLKLNELIEREIGDVLALSSGEYLDKGEYKAFPRDGFYTIVDKTSRIIPSEHIIEGLVGFEVHYSLDREKV